MNNNVHPFSYSFLFHKPFLLPTDKNPNVIIDCTYCNINYIKEQIPIVNNVLDPKETDIHIRLFHKELPLVELILPSIL